MAQMSRRLKDTLTAYTFIAPWIIGFVLFTGGPIIASFALGFFRWKMIAPPRFLGLDNYARMFFEDDLFRLSIKLTFQYVFISLPLAQILALLLAVLLDQPIRSKGFWRTIFYLPAIVSGVAGAVIWMWMYNQHWGVINNLLMLVGIQGPNWLMNKDLALGALIGKSLWNVGVPMVVYLSALQGIPQDIHEAAEIDGAGRLIKFFRITLAMVSPAIFFNVVMGFIGGIQSFSDPYVMTGGGPENATLLLGLHLYQNAFHFLRMGYASAMAWLMFFIIFVLTIIQFKFAGRWVYYEAEG
jgi:multiple sugar transport system permease protein